MSRTIQKGTTDQSVTLYIIDDTGGTPETGVLFNTAGIDLNYRREGGLVVSITPVDLATPALDDPHLDGGFLEIGFGSYRFDLPDAAFASGADFVDIIGTVTGMIVMLENVQLVDYNPMDSTRLGLTALPNAAADAAGGLSISDAGGLDLDGVLSGNIPQTGDNFPRLGAPSGDNISADVATKSTAANLTTVNGVVDAILSLLDDPRTEPGQGAPPVNPDHVTKVDYLFKNWRNKREQTTTEESLYADNGSTVDQKRATSDDTITATKEEWTTGP